MAPQRAENAGFIASIPSRAIQLKKKRKGNAKGLYKIDQLYLLSVLGFLHLRAKSVISP